MSTAQLIERLYAGLGARDGDAMAACYHPEARFEDPAFGELRGPRVGGMWRMLTSRSAGIEVTVSGIVADDAEGRARWEASYVFGPTGRAVHNLIDARYRFEDGLIVEHVDSFSFARWARQALGPTGLLLGWTPMLRNKVRSQARANLERFMAKPHDSSP